MRIIVKVAIVEEAMGRKPAIQRLVDKVAGYFAYAVMIAALSVFLAWYFVVAVGATAMAIIPAVAILVVACPCALCDENYYLKITIKTTMKNNKAANYYN